MRLAHLGAGSLRAVRELDEIRSEAELVTAKAAGRMVRSVASELLCSSRPNEDPTGENYAFERGPQAFSSEAIPLRDCLAATALPLPAPSRFASFPWGAAPPSTARRPELCRSGALRWKTLERSAIAPPRRSGLHGSPPRAGLLTRSACAHRLMPMRCRRARCPPRTHLRPKSGR
jgi:hypothetical protein